MSKEGRYLKQTERHQFHLSNDNVTILGVFRTHAQKEYDKVLEINNTPIVIILALLLF